MPCEPDTRGERHPERVGEGNGYRADREALGSSERSRARRSPSCASGSYFPDWLLTPRGERSEQALTAVIADAYLAGVSTRRVDKLVRTLGIEGISKSCLGVR